MPIGQSAIEFLAGARAELWPGVPVLYVATHSMTVDARALLAGAAGIDFRYEAQEIRPSILSLLPSTRRVALISGVSVARKSAQRQRLCGLPLDVIELSGLTFADTLRRVATLPPDTVVLIDGPLLDAAGRTTPA